MGSMQAKMLDRLPIRSSRKLLEPDGEPNDHEPPPIDFIKSGDLPDYDNRWPSDDVLQTLHEDGVTLENIADWLDKPRHEVERRFEARDLRADTSRTTYDPLEAIDDETLRIWYEDWQFFQEEIGDRLGRTQLSVSEHFRQSDVLTARRPGPLYQWPSDDTLARWAEDAESLEELADRIPSRGLNQPLSRYKLRRKLQQLDEVPELAQWSDRSIYDRIARALTSSDGRARRFRIDGPINTSPDRSPPAPGCFYGVSPVESVALFLRRNGYDTKIRDRTVVETERPLMTGSNWVFRVERFDDPEAVQAPPHTLVRVVNNDAEDIASWWSLPEVSHIESEVFRQSVEILLLTRPTEPMSREAYRWMLEEIGTTLLDLPFDLSVLRDTWSWR